MSTIRYIYRFRYNENNILENNYYTYSYIYLVSILLNLLRIIYHQRRSRIELAKGNEFKLFYTRIVEYGS